VRMVSVVRHSAGMMLWRSWRGSGRRSRLRGFVGGVRSNPGSLMVVRWLLKATRR